MKINILRAILILMLLGTFYIIFGFSSQDAEESSSVSRQVTETVTKDIKKIQKLEPTEKEKVLSKIEHVIRKIAHFSLYTLVGILIMSLMSTYNIKQKTRYKSSLGTGIIYAISDEIHQSFTPGRSPMVGDVFIDTCGVIFGIILVRIGMGIITKIQNKNAKNKVESNI